MSEVKTQWLRKLTVVAEYDDVERLDFVGLQPSITIKSESEKGASVDFVGSPSALAPFVLKRPEFDWEATMLHLQRIKEAADYGAGIQKAEERAAAEAEHKARQAKVVEQLAAGKGAVRRAELV